MKTSSVEMARDGRVNITVSQTVNLDPKGPCLADQFKRSGRLYVDIKLKYMTPDEATDVLNATAITLSMAH